MPWAGLAPQLVNRADAIVAAVPRKQDETITRLILQAAERVMEREGYSALTVEGLTSEVGTSRPTFYRRFPSIAVVALAVFLKRFGGGRKVDTGTLYTDLLELQRDDVLMLNSTLVQQNLPALFQEMRTDRSLQAHYLEQLVAPRRMYIGEVVDRALARGEIPSQPVDLQSICDLLGGPLLSRFLLPAGLPIDDQLARLTTDQVVQLLSRVTPRSG